MVMMGVLIGYLMFVVQYFSDIYKVGFGFVCYLFVVGDLFIGWWLFVLVGVVYVVLVDGLLQNDEVFYWGKIVVVVFFVKNMLLKLIGVCSVIENIDDDIMCVFEDVF